ncbi:MAG: sigma-70 family RNA polymerase sigma factor [Phycisphaerales bacterium]|nr:sigma-70 family RNA polymerase sigma factor [Phycisphaerales bacterium]
MSNFYLTSSHDSENQFLVESPGPHALNAGGLNPAGDAEARLALNPDDSWMLQSTGKQQVRVNGLLVSDDAPELIKAGDFISIDDALFRVDELRRIDGQAVAVDSEQGSTLTTRNWTATNATRPSIFLRLQDEGSVRELGWGEFVEQYGPIVRNYAMSRGLKWDDADDIVQDVMYSFLKRSDTFEYDLERGRFRSYMRTITLNSIRKRARSETRSARIEEELVASSESNLEIQWDLQWMAHIVQKSMQAIKGRFDEKTMDIFERIAIRSEATTSVAESLGMTEVAVRQSRFRVAKALREQVELEKQAHG